MGTAERPVTSRGSSVRELAVIVNVVTAYQRIHLRFDADNLSIDTPLAWLGVVPHDRRIIEVPRAEIVDARVAPAFFPSRLFVAAAFGLAPWLTPLSPIVSTASSVIGFLFLLLAVVVSVRIDLRSGERHVVPVCWFERGAVQDFLTDMEGDGP